MVTERDINVLNKILHYCENINEAVHKFNIKLDDLYEDEYSLAMLGMFVQQIGETTKGLTQGFRESHPEKKWHEIIGMRNVFAHEYQNLDVDIVIDSLKNDIPSLKEYCEKILKEESR